LKNKLKFQINNKEAKARVESKMSKLNELVGNMRNIVEKAQKEKSEIIKREIKPRYLSPPREAALPFV